MVPISFTQFRRYLAPTHFLFSSTYGDEYQLVRKHDIKYIWTLRTTDDGEGFVITSGHGWVNRIGCFVTTKEWVEDIEYDIEA